MKTPLDISGRSVRLEVIDSYSSNYSGYIRIRLERVLRYLKGRRKVWLACSETDQPSLIAKQFFIGGKQLRESQAEWKGLLELNERGVPCPKLLFTAKDAEGGLWVVTEFLENAIELSDLVTGSDEQLNSATLKFAETLLNHWQVGVHQTDAHLRNFLWDGQSIYTIDVGAIRFSKGALALSKRSSILEKMLGGYVESFRLELIRAFSQCCAQLGEDKLLARIKSPEFIRRIENQEAKNLHRIWRKSQRDCSQFLAAKYGQHRLVCQRSLNSTLIEKLKTNPEELMLLGTRLKSGNTCTVQQVEWEGRLMVLKRYNPKPVLYRMTHYFMLSRAMRSWMNGVLLCRMGIPSVMPIAVVEEYRFGLFYRAYFLMEHFEGEDLRDYLNTHKHNLEVFEQAINRLSSLFKRLRRYRIIHGDLKSKNILIKESELSLIDVDGLRFLVSPRRFSRLFRADFKRLLENFKNQPRIKNTLESRLFGIFNT